MMGNMRGKRNTIGLSKKNAFKGSKKNEKTYIVLITQTIPNARKSGRLSLSVLYMF
jgi:hypothetical protein